MIDINGINKLTAELNDKYPELGIAKIEVDKESGKSSFYINPEKNKKLAYMESGILGNVIPRQYQDKASVIKRNDLMREDLDLMLFNKPVFEMDPHNAYELAFRNYYQYGIVSNTIDLLANLASHGFENDVDDPELKYFFDSWCYDINIEQLLESVFLDFFRVGIVYTYKILGNYYPKVSYIKHPDDYKNNNKEFAAKKNIWSSKTIPVEYTVLNPMLVRIDGNLLFNKYSIKLQLPGEFINLFNKDKTTLSLEEKELMKIIPPELRKAAKEGKELLLDSRLVGPIYYKKQPYERYPKPRISRIFDDILYKKSLRDADISTLDGITNYILKITVGSDEYPVVSQEELEAAANLFNTPSKSFDVVWNHTLNIEKIVSPEIGSILGKEKYNQVNDDIAVGLGIVPDSANPETAQLTIRGLMEEIQYARRQVSRWLYKEYSDIANVMGFDKIPKIRWDEGVLRDDILYMNVISQLVDRRMLSYNTALETLGFDYANELENMKNELPLVKEGVFGLSGSPFQQTADGFQNNNTETEDDTETQPNQNAPAGTPSYGRPVNKVGKKKQKQVDSNKRLKTNIKNLKNKRINKQIASDMSDIVDMSDTEFKWFVKQLSDVRKYSDIL